jgi:hypothetical protein
MRTQPRSSFQPTLDQKKNMWRESCHHSPEIPSIFKDPLIDVTIMCDLFRDIDQYFGFIPPCTMPMKSALAVIPDGVDDRPSVHIDQDSIEYAFDVFECAEIIRLVNINIPELLEKLKVTDPLVCCEIDRLVFIASVAPRHTSGSFDFVEWLTTEYEGHVMQTVSTNARVYIYATCLFLFVLNGIVRFNYPSPQTPRDVASCWTCLSRFRSRTKPSGQAVIALAAAFLANMSVNVPQPACATLPSTLLFGGVPPEWLPTVRM